MQSTMPERPQSARQRPHDGEQRHPNKSGALASLIPLATETVDEALRLLRFSNDQSTALRQHLQEVALRHTEAFAHSHPIITPPVVTELRDQITDLLFRELSRHQDVR